MHVDGAQIAAGVVSVHPDELFEQFTSMSVNGAKNLAERAAAQGAFYSFMNEQLKQVYPDLPMLFHTDDRRFLSATEWRALMLIAQAMLPDPLPADGPTIDDVVLNVQSFIRQIRSDALDEIRTMLRWAGIPAALIPVSLVRAWLREQLENPTTALLDALDRLKAIGCVPYYAHPKADALVGYRRPTFEPKFFTRLDVKRSPPANTTFDVVIVGAGVAGALLAQRATRDRRSVLLLEAGPYQPEHDLSTDELRMTARLYKAAGLQATDEQITVLQPQCVGGGGMVNNAVCFQLPAAAFDRWKTAGFPVAEPTLRDAYKTIALDLEIQPISKAAKLVNPALRFLSSLGLPAVPKIDEPPPEGLSEALVNLKDCDGLGLCNSGCGSERKRNAYQVYLKQALETGRCTLVADARAVDISLNAANEVRALKVDVNGDLMDVVGRQYVIAAGTIGSSVLLLGSDVRKRFPDLPIGRRFTANLGCPTFVFSSTQLHPRPSLQISHAYLPPAQPGIVIESWFAPPGTISLSMPGYLQAHAERMRQYANCTVIAPLVGAAPEGTIELDGGGRPKLRLPPNARDLERLKDGLATVSRVVLDSNARGFDHLLIGTREGFEIRSTEDIDAFLSHVTDRSQLRLGTGHPQGGNAMSDTPGLSVVDSAFKVRGVNNLRVCDASIFPDVAGVNPQWTVMALAHLCSQLIDRDLS